MRAQIKPSAYNITLVLRVQSWVGHSAKASWRRSIMGRMGVGGKWAFLVSGGQANKHASPGGGRAWVIPRLCGPDSGNTVSSDLRNRSYLAGAD